MKNIKKVGYLLAVLLVLSGCDCEDNLFKDCPEPPDNNVVVPSPNEVTISVDKSFYGKWVNVENGSFIIIDKRFDFKIKSLGNNFIEIDKNGEKLMLLRKGTNRALVSGKLYDTVGSFQKFNEKKQENMTHYFTALKTGNKKLKNLRITINDGFQKQTKKVRLDGSFSFSKVRNYGDIEVIIIGEQEVDDGNDKNRTVTVFDDNITITENDNNIGNFYVPEVQNEPIQEANFKATQLIDTQDKENRYMYENRTYRGKLIFKNVGNKLAEGLNYTISTSDPYVKDLTYDIVLGSVDINESVEVPFNITFNILDKIKHKVELDFIIRDANGKEWLDNVYVDVFQTPIVVNLKTKSSKLKGYFITPEHEVIDIDTSNIKVTLPRRPEEKYFFVVSNPKSIQKETAYSLGIEVDAPDFKDFQDTTAYEPNNTEEEASKLELGDSIKSFVHKGDIDFYTIDFQSNISFTPPPLPFH